MRQVRSLPGEVVVMEDGRPAGTDGGGHGGGGGVERE